jgi:phage-related protein
MMMENGVEYAENALKPVIGDQIDNLARQAQNIAFNKLVDNKLAALRQAGEDLKSSINEKVDQLMIETSEKKPDQDSPDYDEQVEIYNNWLDEVTQGIKNIHSFFDRIWAKFKELLNKIFKWIRDGVDNLGEKISNAFRLVKKTLFR